MINALRSHARTIGLAVLISGLAGAAGAQEASTPTRGIVKAVSEASISSDLGFRIVSMPFREGQSFRKGDTLVEFDCDALKAELRSADARLSGEKITEANNARLAKYKAVGRFEVALSQAKVEQAAADADLIRIRVEQCTIKAPFDGSVVARTANVAELTDRTKPLMHIVSDQDLEIDMLLPAAWLRWLKAGETFSIAIEETAESITAEVAEISPVVDPVSQTVQVIGRFTGDRRDIRPGMSGPVRFTVPND